MLLLIAAICSGRLKHALLAGQAAADASQSLMGFCGLFSFHKQRTGAERKSVAEFQRTQGVTKRIRDVNPDDLDMAIVIGFWQLLRMESERSSASSGRGDSISFLYSCTGGVSDLRQESFCAFTLLQILKRSAFLRWHCIKVRTDRTAF